MLSTPPPDRKAAWCTAADAGRQMFKVVLLGLLEVRGKLVHRMGLNRLTHWWALPDPRCVRSLGMWKPNEPSVAAANLGYRARC